MKIIEPINRYTSKEKTALRFITDTIVKYIHPQIIYCLTSVSTTVIERSCFTATAKMEERTFECDLLIVLPNGTVTAKNSKKEIRKLTEGYGKVSVLIHPLDYVVQQLRQGSPLFSTTHSSAVVLYEENNAAGLLAQWPEQS